MSRVEELNRLQFSKIKIPTLRIAILSSAKSLQSISFTKSFLKAPIPENNLPDEIIEKYQKEDKSTIYVTKKYQEKGTLLEEYNPQMVYKKLLPLKQIQRHYSSLDNKFFQCDQMENVVPLVEKKNNSSMSSMKSERNTKMTHSRNKSMRQSFDMKKVSRIGSNSLNNVVKHIKGSRPGKKDSDQSFSEPKSYQYKYFWIEIADNTGQEEYVALQDQFIRNVDGFIFMFDCTDPKGTEKLVHMIKRVKRVKDEDIIKDDMEENENHFPAILCSNRMKQSDKPVIGTNEAILFREKYICNAPFLQTCIETSANIVACFDEITKQIDKKKQYDRSMESSKEQEERERIIKELSLKNEGSLKHKIVQKLSGLKNKLSFAHRKQKIGNAFTI